MLEFLVSLVILCVFVAVVLGVIISTIKFAYDNAKTIVIITLLLCLFGAFFT
jgi:hypothetical protein